MYRWFAHLRDEAVFERMNHVVVMANRQRAGCEASPGAAIIGSQSVKTTENGGPDQLLRDHASHGQSRSRDAQASYLSSDVTHLLPNALGSVSETATRPPGLHAPAQTSSRLIRQVVQEQRIPRVLETNMHFIRQASGDGVQRNAVEPQECIDMGYIPLVTPDPIEGFDAENVEQSGPCVAKKALYSCPAPDTRTGYRLVVILRADPSLPPIDPRWNACSGGCSNNERRGRLWASKVRIEGPARLPDFDEEE